MRHRSLALCLILALGLTAAEGDEMDWAVDFPGLYDVVYHGPRLAEPPVGPRLARFLFRADGSWQVYAEPNQDVLVNQKSTYLLFREDGVMKLLRGDRGGDAAIMTVSKDLRRGGVMLMDSDRMIILRPVELVLPDPRAPAPAAEPDVAAVRPLPR